MRTKQAIGRQSRRKGHHFENQVCDVLRVLWPEARRNLSQTRTARREGCDVLGTPLWVECKAGRKVDVKAAWRQAEADRGETGTPILLVVKEDRRRPFVLCTFGTLRGWVNPNGYDDHAWYTPLRLDLSEWMRVQLARARP